MQKCLSIKLLIIDEEEDYKRIINFSNVVELKTVGNT
jgi:hypothetical protein